MGASESMMNETRHTAYGKRGVKLGKRTHVGYASTRGRSGSFKAPVKVYKAKTGGGKLYVLKKGKLTKLPKTRIIVRKTSKAAKTALNKRRIAKNKTLRKKKSVKKDKKKAGRGPGRPRTRKWAGRLSKKEARTRGKIYNQCTLQKLRSDCEGQKMPDGSSRCKWRAPGNRPRCVLGRGNAPPAPPKMPGIAKYQGPIGAINTKGAKLSKSKIPAPPALPGSPRGKIGTPTQAQLQADSVRQFFAQRGNNFGASRPFAPRRPLGFGAYRPKYY